MSGRNLLVDTNIIVYLSKRMLDIEDVVSIGQSIYISVITYMEALGYDFKNKEEKYIEKDIQFIME